MFSKATFNFLDELAANNNRGWFEANKPRYEALVREPALEFIGLAPLSCAEAMGPGLVKLTAGRFAAAAPLMKFLCEAQGVQY